MCRAARALAGAALLVAALAGGAAPANAAGFFAGAGEQDITPPKQGTAAGNAAAATFGPNASGRPDCTIDTAHGRFAMQEPFQDQNGNGQWDPHVDLNTNPPSGPPEPYCDVNGNGRWDGLYADNNFGPLGDVHDPIDVRAVAVSDGVHRPLVYASVMLIGIFDFYTDEARAKLKAMGYDADLVVSADHNESSPDSVGLYGALTTPASVGARSGIDEYYMDFVADRIARAAAQAIHAMAPAKLYANQVSARIPDGESGNRYTPLLDGLSERISDQFPTAVALANDDRIAAVDPKMGILQARGSDGKAIFTVMSLAAHNQEMWMTPPGNVSGDWPGAFERRFDATHSGMSMFLVGDNGSMEDPQTEPPVIPDGSENHKAQDTLYAQTKATGERFADNAAAAAPKATQLTPGPVRFTRRQFCVKLENNGFVALAAAGEFGRRQAYACSGSQPVAPVPNGDVATAGAQFRTYASYADIGPDVQLIDNPAESFPALMLGTPFGMEEASCPNRPNPSVPTWHARAPYRFQVGLADDLIGYLIPAWGFAEMPGLFNTDTCGLNPSTGRDMAGHKHKLESESVGPTAGNDVANNLAAMLDTEPDPVAHVVNGRFVLPNGSYSRWPTGAVGALIPSSGASALDPTGGTLIGDPHTAGFGQRAVDTTGFFMDYDGQPQSSPDITTRGMIVFDSRGCPAARYYLNVYPPLDGSKKLDGAVAQSKVKPVGSCSKSVQPGAGGGPKPGCRDRSRPHTRLARGRSGLRRKGRRLELHGTASDRDCKGHKANVARVTVTVARHLGPGRCRFLLPDGKRFTRTRHCDGRPPLVLLAKGTSGWSLKLAVHLPPGAYTIRSLALDRAGNRELVRRRGANVMELRVHKRR